MIDVRKQKAVRVSLKPEFFAAALAGPFVNQRRAGILPQDIDPKITDPLVERIVGLPEEKFLAIGPVVDYPFPKNKGNLRRKSVRQVRRACFHGQAPGSGRCAKGDAVEIKGSRVTFAGNPAIIAAEVKKGDAVLKLRDESGIPAWAGWRR